ncbi:Hypothetical predicted protein [Cloeon dipterum]|uniref:C-type lectin domain-containing protein n=1 Tax=Cloeon dipterum TaxID=197152 RepID=A0A8S1DRN2_9INSE|nr:Hypothetical predicted protein [Cloeon dipterum]
MFQRNQNPEMRNDFNGPSQKLVRIGDSTYKFPKEKATFEDAMKICEKDNMELTSLDSPEELGKISDYLAYIGLEDSPLFTSLSAIDGNGEKSFGNWGTGPSPGGPGECVVQQKGEMYNASCEAKSNFACEAKEETEGLGLESLASIGDAVLNFVGGKNIVVPSEKADAKQADSICKTQGLELAAFDSLAQLDSVKDFLGDIGLSSSTLITSMKKVTSGGSDWLGDLASALVPQNDPAQDGDCLGLNSLGLVGVTCDMVSNFVCQAPEPTASSNTISSFLSVSEADPVTISTRKTTVTSTTKISLQDNTIPVTTSAEQELSTPISTTMMKSPEVTTTEAEVTTTVAESTSTAATTTTVTGTGTAIGADITSPLSTSTVVESTTTATSGTSGGTTTAATTTTGTTTAATTTTGTTTRTTTAGTTTKTTTTLGSTTTKTFTTTTTAAATTTLVGYFSNSGSKFLLSTNKMVCDSGPSWCASKGYTILCIANAADFKKITDALKDTAITNALNYNGGKLTIGLRKDTTKNVWKWVNNSTFDQSQVKWTALPSDMAGWCGSLDSADLSKATTHWITDPQRVLCEKK